ncbi:MAG: DUF3293 domain-containing protein [Myxococcales bacterium]|nr:DUF3293 domain-containing protein [Myxococcales bacterium]
MITLYRQTWFTSAPGRPARFAVVTAHNPRGRRVGAAENARLDQVLRRALRHRHWPIDAGSRDGAWREASHGVECALAEALALGRRFDQVAVFWVDGDAVWIVACAPGGGRHLAAPWSARWSPGPGVATPQRARLPGP